MKNDVINLLINTFILALETICFMSLLPLLGSDEPARSEKMDWNETSL
jgi:hypothetical protein